MPPPRRENDRARTTHEDCRQTQSAHFISVVELIPESYVAPLDLPTIFGRRAPLQVDLGCGDGSFLALLASQKPAHDFLGIERLLGRVRAATRKAASLTNVRVLRVETTYAVRYLLPPDSVDVFHLLFPDPWPKRRHHQRRIFTSEFLEAVTAALAPGGSFRIATDQSDYFQQIEGIAATSNSLTRAREDPVEVPPATTFEKRFVSAGAPIHRLELRKLSSVI